MALAGRRRGESLPARHPRVLGRVSALSTMTLKTMKKSVPAWLAVAVAATFVGVFVILRSASAAPTTPPWEPQSELGRDPELLQRVGRSDLRRQPRRPGGRLRPCEASPANTGDDIKATLFGRDPQDRRRPRSCGPARSELCRRPIRMPMRPERSGSQHCRWSPVNASDETLAVLIGDFPNTDTSTTDGYANMYQFRLRTSGGASGTSVNWDSADVRSECDEGRLRAASPAGPGRSFTRRLLPVPTARLRRRRRRRRHDVRRPDAVDDADRLDNAHGQHDADGFHDADRQHDADWQHDAHGFDIAHGHHDAHEFHDTDGIPRRPRAD